MIVLTFDSFSAAWELITNRFAPLFVVMIAVPAFAQAPKSERTLTGVWVLKSVDIGGKSATDQALAGLLKNCGGVELGMFYKFREQPKRGMGICVFNNMQLEYNYSAPDKELVVENDGAPTKRFDVKFVDKNMTLRFREPGKTVVMTFAPDE